MHGYQESLFAEGHFAELRNIKLLVELIDMVQTAKSHLPRMASFTGPSGFGKSYACSWASAKYNQTVVYVEAKPWWTQKTMLMAMLQQLGVAPGRTIPEMAEQVMQELAAGRKVLLVDECDHIVDRKLVETVRGIYEGSQSPVILIGEEQLPQKLRKYERFHGRMLTWVQAVPANLADAQSLARLHCPKVIVEDDLLQHLITSVDGSVRRICVNLEHMRTVARGEQLERLSVATWGTRKLIQNTPPQVRRFGA